MRLFLSWCLFLFLYFGWYHFLIQDTFAQEAISSITLEKNNSKIFSSRISAALLKQETLGTLDISFYSSKNIKLKKDKRGYTLWVAPGIYTGTGVMLLRTKNQEKEILIWVEIPQKSPTDFNIFWDVFDVHLQEKALSCEISATADILSTLLGKKISEQSLLDILPKSSYYNALPLKNGTNTLWGNPQEGFVWYIDNSWSIIAKQKLMTGYGVYEKPIASVYQSFWLKTQILTQELHSSDYTKEEHLSYLLQKLSLWDMVQLWGDWCTKEEYDDGILSSKNELTPSNAILGISAKNSCYNIGEARELKWNYIDKNGKEKEHIWLDGEHAFILLGWKWDIKNPSHIRVWDTDTWYHIYPLREWMRKWEKMQYRSIVIEKL